MFALFQSARKTLRRLKLPIFGSVMAMTLEACDPAALTSLSNNGPKVDKNAPVAVALLVPRGGGSASDDLLAQSLENAAALHFFLCAKCVRHRIGDRHYGSWRRRG